MSNYDPNMRDPGLREPVRNTGAASTTWIGAAIVVVLLLIGLGYVYSTNLWGTSMVEHRAAATDSAAPASKPLASPTVNPSVAPATPASPDASKP